MLLRMSLVLLIVWLLGVVGIYDVGVLVHVLLLGGLLLFLLGALKERDAARRKEPGAPGA